MSSRPSFKSLAIACVALAFLATPAFAADGSAAGGGTSALLNIPAWIFNVFDYIVLSMLGLASLAGIALAIDAILHIRQHKIAPPETTEHLRTLISGKQYRDLMDFAATDSTFVSQALYAAIRRAHLKYPAMREALDSAIGEQTSALFRRIEPMNVIGNIGPLLGLLGTVLGMIIAFLTLNAKGGDAKAYELAGGIGIALGHTFLGLFVAIPCLVIYGFYRTRVDKITNCAAMVAEELLESLRPESVKEATLRKETRPSIDSSPGALGSSGPPIPQPQPQSSDDEEND